jgi:hypothetical protein
LRYSNNDVRGNAEASSWKYFNPFLDESKLDFKGLVVFVGFIA